ncbi:MAG TPA: sugar ABC transporter permease, partial [Thermoanaerobaculia bacterium]|nr:sugar ABC transporter permease [Thermoanaerobaculia bacterium]
MSVVSGTGNVGKAAVAPVPASRRILRRLDAKVSPYLYISPFFLVFGAFGLFPLGYTAYVSLTDRNLLNPVSHYIGLANYTALIHDSYFWNAVENTFGIWFLSTVPQLLLALTIAHVLNTKLRARTFFRMAVLLPQVTSLVAVALIFTQLFAHDYGFINYFLGLFGIHHIYWEAGRFSSWVALSVMITWRWTGYNALIYLAAMQSIPEELYEAAAVDGARGFRQFLHVTVPMLRP